MKPVGTDGDFLVYKYTMKGLRNCTIYWLVNKDGIIVGWRHEGCGCKLAPFE